MDANRITMPDTNTIATEGTADTATATPATDTAAATPVAPGAEPTGAVARAEAAVDATAAKATELAEKASATATAAQEKAAEMKEKAEELKEKAAPAVAAASAGLAWAQSINAKLGEADASVTADERHYASLAYLPGMASLALMQRDSAFCQWHGQQALVVNVLTFAVIAFAGIAGGGILFAIMNTILYLLAVFGLAMGYISAKMGKKARIPFIAGMAHVDDHPAA